MLTDTALRKIKAGEKRHKLYDSGGLFLIVNPNGSLWWRLKYRFGGKERGISLGVYPEVTLKRAREKRDEARQMLSDGLDPSKKRRSDKLSAGITFELVAREWLGLHAGKLSPATMAKARWMLETFVYPKLGAKAITSISAPELLSVVRKIEARGLHETAKRTKQRVGQVLRYAIATGRAERDVSADLRGALVSFTSKNHAAVTEPSGVGELLRAIDGFTGQATTCAALRLAPLVFVRPGELRAAEWAEFDLDADEPLWRIPASRMKMKETHLVPLSRQAAAILRNLRGLTGSGRFIFPAIGRKERPISENTMNVALRRLGYPPAAAHEMLERMWAVPGFDAKGIYAVALSQILGFAVPVLFAFRLRRKSAFHKRLILIGTIAMMTAGFGRWPVHFLLHKPLPAMMATFSLLLLVALYDLLSMRRIHRATVFGTTWVVLIESMAIAVGHTAAWRSFATLMHSLRV